MIGKPLSKKPAVERIVELSDWLEEETKKREPHKVSYIIDRQEFEQYSFVDELTITAMLNEQIKLISSSENVIVFDGNTRIGKVRENVITSVGNTMKIVAEGEAVVHITKIYVRTLKTNPHPDELFPQRR